MLNVNERIIKAGKAVKQGQRDASTDPDMIVEQERKSTVSGSKKKDCPDGN